MFCVCCLDEVDSLQTGLVYAVEFSHRSGRDLVNMAKKRTNVIPIIEDARQPAMYRMLVGIIDVIFLDVAQPDQVYLLQRSSGITVLLTVYLLLLLFMIDCCLSVCNSSVSCWWLSKT